MLSHDESVILNFFTNYSKNFLFKVSAIFVMLHIDGWNIRKNLSSMAKIYKY